MSKIRNLDGLLENGDVESRRIVLTIADRTLERLDAYGCIKSVMRLDGDQLVIGTRSWDLNRKRNVYLVGAGKACNHMARAVDEVLGDRLTRGIAIVKIAEESDCFNRTEVHVGGHPIPNQAGLEASIEILRLADEAGPDDLFICVVSGGSSALMNCPIEGITLEDEQIATDVLLKSGAGIFEINAIRRHISQTNGGRLAQRIAESGAELIGIGISDAVGNAPTSDIAVPFERYASTPIGPDRTTLEDARRVIEDYGLAAHLPESIVTYLTSADESEETPKSFPDNTYFVINTVPDSCVVAKSVAEEMGLQAVVLTTFLEGESRYAGATFASIAREIQTFGNPVSAPCVVLAAGETTTTIPDSSVIRGRGGPGQELVVGFALAAAHTEGAAMLSIDTEGTDGTSNVAGGICDSTSAARAAGAGLNLRAALRHHATFEALDAIGDAVLTGNTGTNLCDLNILYVPVSVRAT
jgi:glycerate 2-kinase